MVLVVLDTQVKIKILKRHLLNTIFIISLSVLATSCGIEKKLATSGNSEAKSTSKVSVLTEQQQIEFEYLYIEGLKQKTVGNINIAQQNFIACLEIDPNSAAARYELANIYASKGDLNGALSLVNQAIEINPSNKWYKLFAAQVYQQSKDYQKASDIYKSLIQQFPHNVDFYYMDALLLTSAKNYEGALEAYNNLEKQTEYNEQIALARQQLYREAGKHKEAYKEIEQLIATYPSVPEYYGVLADMYKDDGNMEMALKYYNIVLDKDPNNGFVHFSLANYYAQNQQLDKAFAHTKIGFKNPEIEMDTKVQMYLMHASVSDANHLTNEQLEALIKILIDVHPNDARSYGIAADFMMNNDRVTEAREYMYEALENDPNNYRTWEQLVFIDNQLQDWERMQTDSKNAIELFPNQPVIYVLNAVANIQLENYQETLDVLNSGMKYVIDNPKIEAQFFLYIAEASYNLDKKDTAYQYFEKVLALEPDNFMAMNNYAYYLSVNDEQLDKAERLSGMVVQANPDNDTYLDTHAWVLFRKGEFRLAKFYMENAMKNGGSESDVILEHYGDILFKLNDVEGALKAWNESLEKGNTSELLKRKIEQKTYLEEK